MPSSHRFIEKYLVLKFFFSPHRVLTASTLFALFLSGLLESLNLAALYPVINFGLQLSSLDPKFTLLNQILSQLYPNNLFLAACLLLMIVTVISAIVKIISIYFSNKLISVIVKDNQEAIMEKFIQADYSYFVNNQHGHLVYASTVAPIGLVNIILCTVRFFNNVIYSLCFAGLLILLDWRMTLVVLVIGGIYLLGVRNLVNRVVNISVKEVVQADQKKNVVINEFLSGIKLIKSYLNHDYWKNQYDESVSQSVQHNFRVMMGRVLPDCVIKSIFFMVIGGLGIWMSLKSNQQLLTFIPILATYTAAASRLLPYLNLVGNDIMTIARYFPDTKIVYETLRQSLQHLKTGSAICPKVKEAISFENVYFRYPQTEAYLLKGVSFSLLRGQMTAIVGESGAGKTTIVNLLLRLYDVCEGKILVDGRDVREFSLDSYLKRIAYVSQEPFVFNGTIKENICFGLTDVSSDAIQWAARLANAEDFILKTEKGYETRVGDNGVKLSGGQRQRLTIARAMLRNPEILILDEATSSLDNLAERSIQEAINNISHHTTVVVIAHRLSTIEHADQIIVLEKGQVIEQGSHHELLEEKNVYFNLYTRALI